jgi:hypothetical protein
VEGLTELQDLMNCVILSEHVYKVGAGQVGPSARGQDCRSARHSLRAWLLIRVLHGAFTSRGCCLAPEGRHMPSQTMTHCNLTRSSST